MESQDLWPSLNPALSSGKSSADENLVKLYRMVNSTQACAICGSLSDILWLVGQCLLRITAAEYPHLAAIKFIRNACKFRYRFAYIV